jgi:hypothetical protein
MAFQMPTNIQANEGDFIPGKENIEPVGDDSENGNPPAGNPPGNPPANDDLALIESLKARLGIDFKDFDDLKSKMQPAAPVKPADAEPTDEDLIPYFVKGGGTEDEWKSIKEKLTKDPAELSREAKIDEYKTEFGLNDDEAELMYKSRYFVADEDGDDFFSEAQKKVGEKLRERTANSYKSKLEKKLNAALNAFKAEKNAAKSIQDYAAEVEATVSAFPKKFDFTVGQENEGDGQKKVDFNLSDEDLAEIKKSLSDPAEVAKMIYKDKNTHNLNNIAELLMWRKLGSKFFNHAYGQGANDISQKVVGVFPSVASILPSRGDGGGNNEKNKIQQHNRAVSEKMFAKRV